MQEIFIDQDVDRLRRIPILGLDESDGFTEELGLTITGTIIKADGTKSVAAGSFVELELGQYYYEPTAGEVNVKGFFLVRAVNAAMKTFYGKAQIVDVTGGGFRRNETVPQFRRILILALDFNNGFSEETGISVATLKTNAKVIKGDGTAAAADGTFTELGNGIYQYQFTQAELNVSGFVMLRVVNAVMKTFYAMGQVAFNAPPNDGIGVELQPQGSLNIQSTDGIFELIRIDTL